MFYLFTLGLSDLILATFLVLDQFLSFRLWVLILWKELLFFLNFKIHHKYKSGSTSLYVEFKER